MPFLDIPFSLIVHLCVLHKDMRNPRYTECFPHVIETSNRMHKHDCIALGEELRLKPYKLDKNRGVAVITRTLCAQLRES